MYQAECRLIRPLKMEAKFFSETDCKAECHSQLPSGLQSLLALASVVIVRSKSRGTHNLLQERGSLYLGHPPGCCITVPPCTCDNFYVMFVLRDASWGV
jgi:hypothetical protein